MIAEEADWRCAQSECEEVVDGVVTWFAALAYWIGIEVVRRGERSRRMVMLKR